MFRFHIWKYYISTNTRRSIFDTSHCWIRVFELNNTIF